MLKHEEYSIHVLAAEKEGKCCWLGCKNKGDFFCIIKNDRGEVAARYPTLCEKHLLFAFVEASETVRD